MKKEYRIPYIPRGLCNTTPVIPKYNSGFYFTLGIFVYFCIGKFFHLSLFIAMIKKYLVFSVLLISALFISPTSSSAQFQNGKLYLGPQIGLSEYGGNIAIGGNIEGAITSPGSAGPGRIALDGFIYFTPYTGGSIIIFGGSANYHYSVGDGNKVDLFGGLGLDFITFSNGFYGASAIFFALDFGARYFFSENLAIRAAVGLNLPTLTIGLDFGL